MRNHTEEPASGINDDAASEGNPVLSSRNESQNFNEDEFRRSRKESGDDYYRDSLLNAEDQFETSKLVLQLVTDSRFNMTQINGQRKLGGPPPGWKGPAPGPGCEVFVGKIPRTLYEHEIYPIFRRMGEVYEIRLMMDFSGTNRGYCFVMFGKPEFALRAIGELDNFEIRPGRRIGVVASINNCRLYVGQLPPDVTSETVIKKIYEITDDVGQVAVYRDANDQARYALISYKTHRGAAMARRRLVPDRASLFGDVEVSIDWAHPSMIPSNVVEDTGICDDHGNVEISRLVVGNENKRYQNRRRARDDFLDHSIRAYLQTDRTLEQTTRNKQNASQNQSFNNCLGSVARGLNNFRMFDRNANPNSSPHNYYQRNCFRGGRIRCKSEISIKSRDSNSSFDLNAGSGSSESSGCSSQSSISERNHNLSREFSEQTFSNISPSRYPSQIFYPTYNQGEIFSDRGKIGGEIIAGQEGGKNDLESLNLFDNYTFSVNGHETENREDFNEAGDNGNDLSTAFENSEAENDSVGTNGRENYAGFVPPGEKYLPNIRDDLNTKRESQIAGENGRKSRQQRYKNRNVIQGRNSTLANYENNNNGYNHAPKSLNHASKSSNFENLESFPKTVGVPLKNGLLRSENHSESFAKSERKSLNFESDRSRKDPNLHLCRQNYEDNNRSAVNRDWQSSKLSSPNKIPLHILNNHRSQNRNGISTLVWHKNVKNLGSARFVTENNPLQKQGENRMSYACARIPVSSNPRNFFHDMNSSAKRAWLSAQLGLNACDFSSVSLGNNSMDNSVLYSNSGPSGAYSDLGTSGSAFTPQDNLRVMNFCAGQSFSALTQNGFCQNEKFFSRENSQKGGRPILSRSHAGLYNEN